MIWAIFICALINYGFMLFDGLRGLIVGDYVRPKKGKYAGQLGPWSKLVTAVGIDPDSRTMKLIFVSLGAVGLNCATSLLFTHSAWWPMWMVSLASLWYLTPGTILSCLQIAMLLYILTH